MKTIISLVFLISFFITSSFSQKKWTGNSWNMNLQYGISTSQEFGINIGRTYGQVNCGCLGCTYILNSYGLGYSKIKTPATTYNLIKAYYEYGLFLTPPINPVFRFEYNLITETQQSFLKPEIGFTFIYADVTYSYNINLNSKLVNPIKHGINFRLKLYHKTKNWKRNTWKEYNFN